MGDGHGGREGRDLAADYLDAAIGLLRQVREQGTDALAAGGRLLAEAVASGGRVFATGAGHSSLPAQDLVYRAGGLAVVNLLAVPGVTGVDVRPATLGSALERLDGLAEAALRTSPAREGDVLVVVSLSGRNPLPVRLARTAKGMGLGVIGVTSLAYTRGTTSRDASGTFLADHCDVVLDSRIPVGDATLSVDGVPAPFAPASTVVASALMQALAASAAGELAARGVIPPLLRSGNVDGGHEWNARIMTEYADRIFHQN